jgi:hypothetical protein
MPRKMLSAKVDAGKIIVEVTAEAVAGSYVIRVFDAQDGDETQTKAAFTVILK